MWNLEVFHDKNRESRYSTILCRTNNDEQGHFLEDKESEMVRVDLIRDYWLVRLRLTKEHIVFSIYPCNLTAVYKMWSIIVLLLSVTVSETVGRPTVHTGSPELTAHVRVTNAPTKEYETM